MKKQDKELLLKDLCARLPYGVKVQIKANNCYDGIDTLNLTDLDSFIKNSPRDKDWCDVVTSIKPYLRTMDSMTEEEREIYNNMTYVEGERYISSEICSNVINFLNAHHLDYRGLIHLGLALLALEGMYNFK